MGIKKTETSNIWGHLFILFTTCLVYNKQSGAKSIYNKQSGTKSIYNKQSGTKSI